VVSVHNFSYGLINPALGYLVSCLGAFLGLRCLTRARAHEGRGRAGWLTVAAIAVGACGIWAMHFIAMLGFTIPGQQILYNVPLTIASMVLAVVVVGAGLFIVGYGDGSWPRLLAGGIIVGLGVASMHYLGMAAMSMKDSMTYAPGLFGLSLAIAVVAGTAALWIGTWVRGLTATFGASLVMGVAVSGMHYTGMAAMQVTTGTAGMPGMQVSGSTASSLLLPLVLGITLITLLLTLVVSLSRTEDEIAEDAVIEQRLNEAARASSTQVTARPATPSAGRPASRYPGAGAAPAQPPPPSASPFAGRPARSPGGGGAGTGGPAPDQPLVTRIPGASGRGTPPPVR
jgi:NO-binding membrane sensor protein with MHYT domain